MNNIQKSLIFIFFTTALLVTPAILMTAGVFSFGGAAQPFLIVFLFLLAFAVPFLLPEPQFNRGQSSHKHG